MNNPTPPKSPGEWSLAQITEALSRPLPKNYLKTLPDKGKCQYLPWYTAVAILNKYAMGWHWEIKQITTTGDRLFMVGRLSIPTSDGVITREASGTEVLKRRIWNYDTERFDEKELPYGYPSSNSESMAFRRCAAKFGLGLYLYEK